MSSITKLRFSYFLKGRGGDGGRVILIYFQIKENTNFKKYSLIFFGINFKTPKQILKSKNKTNNIPIIWALASPKSLRHP